MRHGGGQQTTIEITSPSGLANFSLVGLTDGQPLKRLENEQRTWSGQLPETQDYRLTVAAPGDAGPTDYSLTVTILPLTN